MILKVSIVRTSINHASINCGVTAVFMSLTSPSSLNYITFICYFSHEDQFILLYLHDRFVIPLELDIEFQLFYMYVTILPFLDALYLRINRTCCNNNDGDGDDRGKLKRND